MAYVNSGIPINLSASGAVSLTPTQMLGFYVNSTSSGTINFKDGGSGGTAICGTITPAIGWHAFPASFTSNTGAYFTIVSGSINVTVFTHS